jgi:hypothetical protein
MADDRRYTRTFFVDLVDTPPLDLTRVDLPPEADWLKVALRVGDRLVTTAVRTLTHERLVTGRSVVVPTGAFVVMRIDLTSVGLPVLELTGLVERARPGLVVRFEALDMTARERLVHAVAVLAEMVAAKAEPSVAMSRVSVLAAEVDSLRELVLELRAEKDALREQLDRQHHDLAAMLRALHRDLKRERHRGTPPPPPPTNVLDDNLHEAVAAWQAVQEDEPTSVTRIISSDSQPSAG